MENPIQISFRRLPYSPYLSATVRKKAEKLLKFYPRILSMRILLEPSERRHHQGNLYHVGIDLVVPGQKIVVRRDPSEDHSHENMYVAIRDAFDIAKRKLEDYVRIHFRGKQKHREGPIYGTVTRIFRNEDCGFLQTQDGREIYFHKNSVLNHGFDRIEIGDEVRIAEEIGEKGQQASSVVRIGKGKHTKVA